MLRVLIFHSIICVNSETGNDPKCFAQRNCTVWVNSIWNVDDIKDYQRVVSEKECGSFKVSKQEEQLEDVTDDLRVKMGFEFKLHELMDLRGLLKEVYIQLASQQNHTVSYSISSTPSSDYEVTGIVILNRAPFNKAGDDEKSIDKQKGEVEFLYFMLTDKETGSPLIIDKIENTNKLKTSITVSGEPCSLKRFFSYENKRPTGVPRIQTNINKSFYKFNFAHWHKRSIELGIIATVEMCKKATLHFDNDKKSINENIKENCLDIIRTIIGYTSLFFEEQLNMELRIGTFKVVEYKCSNTLHFENDRPKIKKIMASSKLPQKALWIFFIGCLPDSTSENYTTAMAKTRSFTRTPHNWVLTRVLKPKQENVSPHVFITQTVWFLTHEIGHTVGFAHKFSPTDRETFPASFDNDNLFGIMDYENDGIIKLNHQISKFYEDTVQFWEGHEQEWKFTKIDGNRCTRDDDCANNGTYKWCDGYSRRCSRKTINNVAKFLPKIFETKKDAKIISLVLHKNKAKESGADYRKMAFERMKYYWDPLSGSPTWFF